jgi:hypothetical protein
MPIVLGRKIDIGREGHRPELIIGTRYYVKTTEIYNGVNVILSGVFLRHYWVYLEFEELKLEQPVLDPRGWRVRLPSGTRFRAPEVEIYTIPEQPVPIIAPVVNNGPGPVVLLRNMTNNDPKTLEGGYTKNRKSRSRRKQKKQSRVK